ncbi:MAG: aldo/keto reductase, partial [Candidatus Hodarchaeota archaeon]
MESDIIKSVGTSSFQPEVLREWEEHIPTSLVQLPLNPMQQKAYQLARTTCQELDIGLITYSPFFMGIFWSNPEDLESIDKRINAPSKWKNCLISLNQDLKEQSQTIGIEISGLILNWILWHKDVTGVLVGTNNIDHLKQNTSVFDQSVNTREVKQIDECMRRHYEKIQSENRPGFEVTVESMKKNSQGKHIAISDFGLILSVLRFYPSGTKLYLDIETAEVLEFNLPPY